MDAKRLVLTRLLPKTGQITSYRAGDDGDYEAGWWRGRLNADNKTRFIHIGTGINTLVKDLATGLMWPADGNSVGCHSGVICRWVVAIDYANVLDFAGFTDWRVPNIKELMSIVDFIRSNPAIDIAKFPNTVSGRYWASTTYQGYSGFAWYVDFVAGYVTVVDKDDEYYLRCVRGGL